VSDLRLLPSSKVNSKLISSTDGTYENPLLLDITPPTSPTPNEIDDPHPSPTSKRVEVPSLSSRLGPPLPIELVSMIVRELRHGRQYATLAKLAQANSAYFNLAMPKLHETITISATNAMELDLGYGPSGPESELPMAHVFGLDDYWEARDAPASEKETIARSESRKELAQEKCLRLIIDVAINNPRLPRSRFWPTVQSIPQRDGNRIESSNIAGHPKDGSSRVSFAGSSVVALFIIEHQSRQRYNVYRQDQAGSATSVAYPIRSHIAVVSLESMSTNPTRFDPIRDLRHESLPSRLSFVLYGCRILLRPERHSARRLRTRFSTVVVQSLLQGQTRNSPPTSTLRHPFAHFQRSRSTEQSVRSESSGSRPQRTTSE